MNTDSTAGGWTVCPICGAVIADTWVHATWHETTLADVIADTITTPHRPGRAGCVS